MFYQISYFPNKISGPLRLSFSCRHAPFCHTFIWFPLPPFHSILHSEFRREKCTFSPLRMDRDKGEIPIHSLSHCVVLVFDRRLCWDQTNMWQICITECPSRCIQDIMFALFHLLNKGQLSRNQPVPYYFVNNIFKFQHIFGPSLSYYNTSYTVMVVTILQTAQFPWFKCQKKVAACT